MASERVQRRIDRLIDQIEAAADQRDWQLVLRLSEDVLAVEPANADAAVYVGAAKRNLDPASSPPQDSPASNAVAQPTTEQPTSFANGRYQVKRFLGEGGKKRVYLAQDTTLDREVAFAVIKTEGLDETSRTRIQREAQAMDRLGSHPHIVTVFDLVKRRTSPTW